MKVYETELPGVLLIEPRVFGDSRGSFHELWQAERYQGAQLPGMFVQANFARSTQGVVRGLHYQLTQPQGKLVWVTRGEVLDVAVDIRVGSPTFGKWVGRILSEDNHFQLFIPPGFSHGYSVLSPIADFMYFCTALYDPGDEYGIFWADRDLGIKWQVQYPKLSDKDQKYPTLGTVPHDRLPLMKA